MDTPTPQSHPMHTTQQVETRLAQAAGAFAKWRWRAMEDRVALLRALTVRLEAEVEPLARLMTTEMGKPLAAARAEVLKCAMVCRFYAEQGPGFLRTEALQGPAPVNQVRFDPIGPVLAVMPWNFPFWQVFRFAAPAVLAGNVGLLKHASNVPGCALAMERLFREAGFPEGVFSTLLIPASEVEAVIHDRRVAAVTLTGSVQAGRKVASMAGAALKKTVLELGGSDPFIILPDADLKRAVEVAVQARMVNSGQSCIAAKRFLIHADVYEQVEAALKGMVEAMTVGDPFSEATQVGPLATEGIVAEVAGQVEAALGAGARLVTGGKRLEGTIYAPTILADIPVGAAIASEEVFGPVALLFRINSLDQAIQLANSSDFGLGAAIWTADPDSAAYAVAHLESGAVFVNGMVASDPRLPFGGIKDSGYGRELGVFGIREFVNIKTICRFK